MAGQSEVLIILRAVNQASGVLKQAEGEVAGLGSATKSLVVDTLAASAVVAAFGVAVKSAYDFGKEGAQIERLRDTGALLAKSYGVDMSEAVAKIKAASLDTITTVQAVTSANRLLLLGITRDTDTMAKLTQIAAIRGRAFGLDTSEALDRITLGIGRLSTRILDDIGIVIKGQEAYDIYAKSIGKTADQLTGVEQRIALTNAIIEDGNKLLAATGGLTDDNASKITRMETALTDLGNTLKEDVAPYVANFADGLNSIITLTPELLRGMAKHDLAVIALAEHYLNLDTNVRSFLDSGIVGFYNTVMPGVFQKDADAIAKAQAALQDYIRGEKQLFDAQHALETQRAGEKIGSFGILAQDAAALGRKTAFRDKAFAIQKDLDESIVKLDLDMARKEEDIATDLARKLFDIKTDLQRKLQDIDTDLANKTQDINIGHNDKMLDIERNYQREKRTIIDRFELARLRALIDRDARALFEAENGRDNDLASAAKKRKQDKQDEQNEYQRKLRDAQLAAERERQRAQTDYLRQQADARLNMERQIADAKLAYARRYNDLSLASAQEFSLWVQSQQATTQFLRASYAVQEQDYANHLNNMLAMSGQDERIALGATGTSAMQGGTLGLNINVSGTGSLQQIVQQTTYSALYDIFTLPGGQVVYKLKGQ